MNNDQEIILAKISAVYDKPPFVKMETGQMEMILKCVGLGAYYDKYREYLEPYWYNGRFQNPVESYRIFVGLNSIFEDLLNERKGDEIISLLTELGNYIPGTILSDEARFAADFNKLRQLYNLMGLQIVSMEVDEYSSKFQVEPYLNEGNQIIQSFGMERWLKSKYQDVYEAYESALNSFSSGDLGAATGRKAGHILCGCKIYGGILEGMSWQNTSLSISSTYPKSSKRLTERRSTTI